MALHVRAIAYGWLAAIDRYALALSFSLAPTSVNPGLLIGETTNLPRGDKVADAFPKEAGDWLRGLARADAIGGVLEHIPVGASKAVL